MVARSYPPPHPAPFFLGAAPKILLIYHQSPRIRHGEETCDDGPVSSGGGDAVEPMARPRSVPRRSTRNVWGVNVADMVTSSGEREGAVVDVVAANANRSGGVGNGDASVAQTDGGNGGVSISRGGSEDVVNTEGRQDLLPTSINKGDVNATGVSGEQSRDVGDGGRVSQGDGVGGYSFEREEGWVDQYTNSSLGAASPSVTSDIIQSGGGGGKGEGALG